jgi:hypothetical protein
MRPQSTLALRSIFMELLHKINHCIIKGLVFFAHIMILYGLKVS